MDSAQEMKAHEKTYSWFIGLLKWTIPPTLLIVLLVIILIA